MGFLKCNLGALELPDDALISTGFNISKEYTKALSTLKRASALSNSPLYHAFVEFTPSQCLSPIHCWALWSLVLFDPV